MVSNSAVPRRIAGLASRRKTVQLSLINQKYLATTIKNRSHDFVRHETINPTR